MSSSYKLGKQNPSNKRALMLKDVLTGTLPTIPVSVDHLAQELQWELGTNDQFGTCVSPETPVLTADLTWIPVGDISVGDKLLGFDEASNGSGRSYRVGVVEEAVVVEKPCYDLTFDDGTTVRCSDDHKWLTSSAEQGKLKTQQWCTTRDLISDDVRRSKIIKSFDVWETDKSWESGYLAGAFDGEGSLEQTRHGKYANRLRYVQADNAMLAEVERCLKELDYAFTHTVSSPGTRLRVDGTPRHDKHVIGISDRSQYLRFLGSVRPLRLLAKLDANRLGRINGRSVSLIDKKYVGVQKVVKLETTARTYFAAGLASHNCGPTSVANFRRLILTAFNLPTPVPALTDIYDLYKRSGNPNFNPTLSESDPNQQDNGVDMQTMLEALLEGGIGGVKPVAFAKIAADDMDTLDAAIAIFGGVLLGLSLDKEQQRQGVWDHVSGGTPWGGHAVLAGKYNNPDGTDNDRVDIVTWAKDQPVTRAFVEAQEDEAWVVIWPEMLQDKTFLQGVDLNALAAAFRQLTGRDLPTNAPAPVPAAPEPSAAPVPAPGRGVIEAPVPWYRRLLLTLHRILDDLQ